MSTMPSDTPQSAPPIDIEVLRMRLSSIVASAKSKVSIDSLRPLPVFLGIRDAEHGLRLSTSAFTNVTLRSIPSRIQSNVDFFLSNYVLCGVMVATVVSLMHVEMIVTLAGVYGLWMLHSYLIQHSVVIFNIPIHAVLTVQQRFYVLFCISAIAIIWVCMVPAMICMGISAVLILGHAILRNPNNRSLDVSQRADEEGETSPLVSKV